MPITTALLDFFGRLFSLSWLTGPIFDKELRVSSRRRRNYVLRFAYLVLLSFFLVLVWIEEVRYSGSAVYRISRMARAGQTIIACTVWFQFCATQVVAVIMLSTSVSDEIYNRTLGLLMTTPINSFQIVMGKLFSKLLQLILLLAISLPLLAIVRVFGGVPWDYVISSLCMTLTTVIFVGSLSLFFSIFSRRAYVVIIVTTVTIGILFAFIPLLAFMLWETMDLRAMISQKTLFVVLFVPNPYCSMFSNTMMMMEPRAAAGMPALLWPLHCGIMLAASTVVLSVSVVKVRKVALRQAIGQLGVSLRKRRSGGNAAQASPNQQDFAATTRRVIGPPVLWKELRFPMLGRRKVATFIAALVGLILLLITYALCAKEDILHEYPVQTLYATVFLGLGMLFSIVLPSTCITSEKESRSWPLLLVTTVDDRAILLGKFAGILRRCLPVWCVLFGHVIFFSLADFIHPIAVIQIGILVVWVAVFLTGAGVYFSSCFRRTTTAVIMNFALAAVIWGILPLLMTMVAAITHEGRDLVEVYMDTNPFVHAFAIMVATGTRNAPDLYPWIGLGRADVVESTIWMLVCMAGYVMLGSLFAWRAECRFRRNVF
ncbi:MAG: ABC transporter permease [Planctomycetota bacterium]|jgi:ABC-type transport system involved in multi-copper enzyme maturation permease subunit